MNYSHFGELTVSLWRTHCLFSWRTCYDIFVIFWITRRFGRVVFWIASLGPISLGDSNVTVRLLLFSQICCVLLDFSPWTNISWWCRRYGWTSSIYRNLLLSYSCLVATFICLLLYCYPIYFMMLSQILIWQIIYKTTGQYLTHYFNKCIS